MGEFVALPQPGSLPLPEGRPWQRSPCGRLAMATDGPADTGASFGDRFSVVIRGHGTGAGHHRHHLSPEELADRLAEELRRHPWRAVLRHLWGPFAGALALPRDRLVVFRDRFGRHPVQLLAHPDRWSATSDPSIASSWAGTPCARTLLNFLHGVDGATRRDFLQGLHRLRPGEACLLITDGPPTFTTWWSPRPSSLSLDTALPRFFQNLPKLYGHLPADLALSAGLDSAGLATALAEHPDLQTFCFSDPRGPADEAPGAQEVSDHLGLPHRRIHISRRVPLRALSSHHGPVAWGPPAHPDGAWKRDLLDPLRRRGRALFYGNGADELLWVPPQIWLRDQWRRWDVTTLREAFHHLDLYSWLRPALPLSMPGASRHRTADLPSWRRPELWLPRGSVVGRPGPTDSFTTLRAHRISSWRWEMITRSLAREERRLQGPVITPYLDGPLWEAGLGASPSDLVDDGRQKGPLRAFLNGRVPSATLGRHKSGGFDAVVERGLATEESHRVIQLVATSGLPGLVGLDLVHFLRAFEAYRRHRPSTGCRGSWAIWRTVAAALWMHQLDSNALRRRS